MASGNRPRGQERPQGEWWIIVAVGAGTFMSALDSSAVNAVLPVIHRSLGGTVSAIEWVVTAYMLAVGGLLLGFGRLGDWWGHKRLYTAGLGVFVAASGLCGLAPNANALVAFRALQGIGAAMLFANSPALLTRNFRATRRGEVLGLQASMTYLGLMSGPSLGGWLTGEFGWRAVFFINVPVGLAGLGLSQRFLPNEPRPGGDLRFDAAGAAAWFAGLGAVLLVLNQGHAYGWGSFPILALLGVATVLMAGFVSIERRAPHPMLDLDLFRRLTFSAATVSAALNYLCVYSIVFLMPFYLIRGRGFSAARAGLLLTVSALVRAVSSPLFGLLSDRIGTRRLTTAGMATLAVGLCLLSRLDGHSSLGLMVVGLGVAGLGAAMFVAPNTSALMGAAPRHQQGIAGGVMATARNVGMALGVGLAGAILNTALAHGAQLGPTAELFRAARLGFLLAAGVAASGAVVSAMGRSSREEDQQPSSYALAG